MKKVAILAIEGATSFSVLGSLDMLSKVNQIASLAGLKEERVYFEPKLVSAKDKVVKSSCGNPFICDTNIATNEDYDLIILPSCDGDIIETVEDNAELIPWLRNQHNGGATLASVCTGAFLLAQTGLMKNKKITTHWAYFELLQNLFPDTIIEPSQNIIDHGDLIAAGGGTSFVHLVMYLIEKCYGHELATLCAKYMLVDLEKIPQPTYSVFTPQKQHGDRQVLIAQDYIEKNYQEKLSIELISRHVALGSRTLMRRFKKCTSRSVLEYIQAVRVEKAKKLLENHGETLQTIMHAVGYNDMPSFRKAFIKTTGLGFKDYKKKYNMLVPYS